MEQNQEFEHRKETALKAAQEQGIVDIVTSSPDGISLETVNLATELMKKHRAKTYESLEKRRQGMVRK